MRWISPLVCWILFAAVPLAAQETYTFEASEIEKKVYHFGGYAEFKPVLFALDRDAAFYRLRFYNDPRGRTLSEWNGRIQLEGSYEKELFRLFAKTNTDLKESYAGGSERTDFYEAYASLKPAALPKIDAGKKALKWGKGYAWNPVAFLDRPKDPDDPEQALEGYLLVTADYIKSFEGPLKTFSFTPVFFPVYGHVNETFGNKDRINIAGKFYFLFLDTDIDLIFLTGGSRTDRYGVDFSRNVTTNFEVHGEFAFIRNVRKNAVNADGTQLTTEDDARSWLLGIRHLTAFDLTTIVEYYHNGAGFSGDELKNFYGYVNRGYRTYQTTGDAAALSNAQRMAEGGYGRFSPMSDYAYVRFSQKEPLDILYVTPSLTWMFNTGDSSWSLTPEVLYTGFTNWEIRFRLGFIVGGRDTEFGEKQNDGRIELRVGYYF